MSEQPRFEPGDEVNLSWMGHTVLGTIRELALTGGHPHKIPIYRVEIPGVVGNPFFREDELEPKPA